MIFAVLMIVSAASEPRVLAVSLPPNSERSSVLLHVVTTPDAQTPATCDLSALGGRAEEFVIVRTQNNQVIPIVPLTASERTPCATPATVDAARAAAKKEALKWSLNPDATPIDALPVDGKNMRIESSVISKGKPSARASKTLVDTHRHVYFAPNGVALATSTDEPLPGKSVALSAWLINVGGRTLILERTTYDRASALPATSYRVSGPVKLPANGFDALVAAPPKVPAGCDVSIAADREMLTSYPVTLAYLFSTSKGPAPITEAQATRDKTEVFALPQCTAVANEIATKLPGGATVAELDWKAPGGIVIALAARLPM